MWTLDSMEALAEDPQYKSLVEALREQDYEPREHLNNFQMVRTVDPGDGGSAIEVVVAFLRPLSKRAARCSQRISHPTGIRRRPRHPVLRDDRNRGQDARRWQKSGHDRGRLHPRFAYHESVRRSSHLDVKPPVAEVRFFIGPILASTTLGRNQGDLRIPAQSPHFPTPPFEAASPSRKSRCLTSRH